MASALEMLKRQEEPSSDDARDSNKGVGIGAKQAKFEIAFYPSDGSDGESFEYSLLQRQTFSRNWKRITLHFLSHTVTIEGRNLRGLMQRIASHVCDTVEVTDGLEAADMPRYEVSGVTVEPVEG